MVNTKGKVYMRKRTRLICGVASFCTMYTSVLVGTGLNNIDIYAEKDDAPIVHEVDKVKSKKVSMSNKVIIHDNKTKRKVIMKKKKVLKFIKSESIMYTNDVVNLRSDGSLSSNVICTVGFARQVNVLGHFKGSKWFKVKYNNKVGFMYSEYLTKNCPVMKISSTAYWDKYKRHSASGRTLVSGHSIAGKIEWLGKTVELYKCNEDGSIGECMGTFVFDDTGYGAESGVGSSIILDGRSIGTIENGTCIDIYKDTYSECMAYGRHDIFIRFLD